MSTKAKQVEVESVYDLEKLPQAFVDIYNADDDELQAPIFGADYLQALEARTKERLSALLKDQPHLLALSEQIYRLRTLSVSAGADHVRAEVNKDIIACVLDVENQISNEMFMAGV